LLVGGLLLLIVGAALGAAAGGSKDDEVSTSSSLSTTTTKPPTTTTTQRPTTTTEPPTTTTTAPPEPISLQGSGDSVEQFSPLTSATTATITHQGSANFAIWALGTTLEQTGLLVNEIGSYSGTVLIPRGTAGLEITADGTWSIQIAPG
jgi:hypothetical protein